MSQRAISSVPFGLGDINFTLRGEVVSRGGKSTIEGSFPQIADDHGTYSPERRTLSVQKDGSLQTRPAGTSGAYEVFTEGRHGMIYQPVDERVFVFPYEDGVR